MPAHTEKLCATVNGADHREDGTTQCVWGFTVEVKREPMPHHKAGLSFTASGYGSRMPTVYMVRFNGKWRRVYLRCYSNTGTLYIGKLPKFGERLTVNVWSE